jgi:hypothetical protein
VNLVTQVGAARAAGSVDATGPRHKLPYTLHWFYMVRGCAHEVEHSEASL